MSCARPCKRYLASPKTSASGIIGPLNERQERYLGLIMESAQHLLSLINDILEFTKSGTSPSKLELMAVPVAHLCESSMSMVRGTALRKRLNMALSLESHDLVVTADERILRQILVNLLSNAVKFTAEGGAIGLETTIGTAGEHLLFTVWDTGIGIDNRDKERLFQPFVQLDSGLNRRYGGTGLGLALAARLATIHGGEITLESTPGMGSRFTLSIPLRLPQVVQAQG